MLKSKLSGRAALERLMQFRSIKNKAHAEIDAWKKGIQISELGAKSGKKASSILFFDSQERKKEPRIRCWIEMSSLFQVFQETLLISFHFCERVEMKAATELVCILLSNAKLTHLIIRNKSLWRGNLARELNKQPATLSTRSKDALFLRDQSCLYSSKSGKSKTQEIFVVTFR